MKCHHIELPRRRETTTDHPDFYTQLQRLELRFPRMRGLLHWLRVFAVGTVPAGYSVGRGQAERRWLPT